MWALFVAACLINFHLGVEMDSEADTALITGENGLQYASR